MASLDDEADVPQSVSNYWFADETDEAVSFVVLPLKWTDDESVDNNNEDIFVRGAVDNGLEKIHKQAFAWKFDLDNMRPEIRVLTKKKTWIKLEKPRRSYENIIRSILITVHCFHILKRNPETPEKSLWDQLSRVYSSYELKPSQNDLVDHRPLISEAVKKYKSLGKSKFLITLLEEKSRKRKVHEEVLPDFIVDDDDAMDDVEDDGEGDDEELFDSVCAFCDNGGDLYCCEGSCLRSFHGTVEAGEESTCESLCLSEQEVKALDTDDFFCKNCQHKKHQCFACGKLGSSDKESLKAEVFRCSNATCGHFYHPSCIANLICGESVADAKDLQERITGGESFTCPYHKCCACKGIENKKIKEFQFAICRRCPTSYHRKCLPREIYFDDDDDDAEEGRITRAWDDLLPNRILLYCLKHEIDDELCTPLRDHIKFPEVEGKKTSKHRLAMKSPIRDSVSKKSDLTSEDSTELRATKVVSKKREFSSGNSVQGSTATKEPKRLSSVAKGSLTTKKYDRVFSRSNPSKMVKVTDVSQKPLKKGGKCVSAMADKLSAPDPEDSIGARFYSYMNKDSEEPKVGKQDNTNSELKKTASKSTKKKSISEPLALDADTQRRLLDLMKATESEITLENVMKKFKPPSTHAHSSKTMVDKNITWGKVEGSVEAVRTALKKLEGGGSIDDAAAVCEPQILNQIYKWKNKLRVYLAPFLHGMRYSSFGRHFTKVDKLEEIVDRLHWYCENGDTIVDFCCGANDFSCLMKKKLEEMGKSCLYKNFDILQPKNDFNFEKKDWMTVRKKDFPLGSQLIIGLNPPFGVKAALANKFIDKALEFNPKLVILIVPPETERLDQKKTPYDLIWEDGSSLSGKSFYLPGSVDILDKQMDQWNLKPPVLYLWSRCDWTEKHMSLAEKHGHGHRSNSEESDHSKNDHGYDTEVNHDLPTQTEEVHNSERIVSENTDNKFSSHSLSDRQSQDGLCHVKNQSTENPKESIKPLEDNKRHIEKPPSVNETYNRTARHSPSNVTDSFDGPHHNSVDNASPMKDIEVVHQRLERSKSNSRMQFGSGSDDVDARSNRVTTDDTSRRYNNIPSSEPYLSGPHKTGLEEPPLAGREKDSTDTFGYNGPYKTGLEEPFSGPRRNDADSFGYNGPYTTGPEELFTGHVRNSADSFGYNGLYNTGLEEPMFAGADTFGYNRPYAREVYREDDLRSRIRMYGQDPEPPRYDSIGGSLPLMSYGFAGSSAEPTYSSSVMNRYAPRLDEQNPPMMSSFTPEPRPVMNRSGFYDSRAPPQAPPPQLQPQPQPHYLHHPGYGTDSMGFAPGPRHAYPPHNSAGWLNE